MSVQFWQLQATRVVVNKRACLPRHSL